MIKLEPSTRKAAIVTGYAAATPRAGGVPCTTKVSVGYLTLIKVKMMIR